ncbi:hypothetical protein BSKO_06450 [Bryopsis sp. KO-2023]|nr:hypothetical protein BSKO_06450 [Bryopsis sp. KO-2023]
MLSRFQRLTAARSLVALARVGGCKETVRNSTPIEPPSAWGGWRLHERNVAWDFARNFAASAQPHQDEVDEINELFAQAREEIKDARDDSETVYFDEAVEESRKLVTEVLDKWNALLGKLDDEPKAKLQRSMGLKIEQLKAEFDEVSKLHA